MKVGIAGLGLIGGSLALKLVKSGHNVIAWNHRFEPYDSARKQGIVCVNSLEELAGLEPDILVLCTPLKAMDSILETLERVLLPHTTLTDVGSVKREVLSSVTKHHLRQQFVGAHPMTGNENASFAAADVHLFDAATWAVTVEGDTDFSRFLIVARLITDGAQNRFIVTDAHAHDLAAAQISHMPHVVATVLANQLVESSESNVAVALAAGSWRDMTRVAMTSPDRTQAMVEENPDNVAILVRDIARRLNEVADILDGDNSADKLVPLKRFFAEAEPYRRVRMELSKGIPAGMYSVHLDTDDDTWKAQLIQISQKGGRVEYIDAQEAHIRDFAHIR
ncbi:prephenate dehydrogenase [Alloscardovia venturai]|uniref:Prephenate dehydrogenase n=1 Tax=Alloscardovia venturai TaxID=1769421 RepID=A0ABW2Y5T2_9BIFI